MLLTCRYLPSDQHTLLPNQQGCLHLQVFTCRLRLTQQGVLQAVAGPAKRVKTFVRTVRHMGLLPVKQKTVHATEPQVSPQLAGSLAIRAANFGQQCNQNDGNPLPASTSSTLSAALERNGSATRPAPVLVSHPKSSKAQVLTVTLYVACGMHLSQEHHKHLVQADTL